MAEVPLYVIWTLSTWDWGSFSPFLLLWGKLPIDYFPGVLTSLRALSGEPALGFPSLWPSSRGHAPSPSPCDQSGNFRVVDDTLHVASAVTVICVRKPVAIIKGWEPCGSRWRAPGSLHSLPPWLPRASMPGSRRAQMLHTGQTRPPLLPAPVWRFLRLQNESTV